MPHKHVLSVQLYFFSINYIFCELKIKAENVLQRVNHRLKPHKQKIKPHYEFSNVFFS